VAEKRAQAVEEAAKDGDGYTSSDSTGEQYLMSIIYFLGLM